MRTIKINIIAAALFARAVATGNDYPNLWFNCWLDAHRIA